MNLQIFDILNDVATRLRDFLARSLASIRSDWWNALVVANLT